MSTDKTTALVTGASSGLGADYCRQLAGRCDRIIAVARRFERLEQLRDELADEVELIPVLADLASTEGVARCIEAIRQQGPISILVNNAGFAVFGAYADSDIDAQQKMVDVHVSATMALCRAALPAMCAAGYGRIVNVSSLGAFLPVSGGEVYGATKAFLNLFSISLQQSVKEQGVRVQALCPGYTVTEIHEAGGMDVSGVPDEMWMSSPDVVACSLQHLDAGPVLVIPGEQNVAIAEMGLQQQLQQLRGDSVK